MVQSSERLETILVVDDTPEVLRMVVAILEHSNFTVLQARNGEEALGLSARHTGKIDLLLSDIQMQSMSGPELGEALKKLRPDVHIMLMSGLTGGNLLVLNYGWAFIEKPFLAEKLLEMVNEVLHSPDKSQGSKRYDSRK